MNEELEELQKLEIEVDNKLKSIPMQQRDIEDAKIRIDKKWAKNSFYIPNESPIESTNNPIKIPSTAFRTYDKEIYIRDGITGQITNYNKRVKGKKARKEEKRRRRMK